MDGIPDIVFITECKTAFILSFLQKKVIYAAAATAAELKAVKKELDEAKKAAMGDAAGDLYENAKEINGKKLITVKFDGAGIDELRSLSDDIKKKYKSVVMVLAAVNEPKVTFLVSVTDDLVEAGVHAGKLVKEIAAACGGGGGGKAGGALHFPQGGSRFCRSEPFHLAIPP